jgi:hypothetical protein
MGSKLDRWTGAACAALIVGALLACKKKEEPPPPVATTPAPEPPKEEPKKEEPKKKEKVKRYPDKEMEESGTVRVIVHHLKVYEDTDESGDHIATLSYGTLVNRKARVGNWMLIDWPSGVGELSPGWVLNRQIATKVEKVNPEDVAKQDAGAVVAEAPKAEVPDAAAAAAPKQDAAPAPIATGAVDAGLPRIPRLKLPPKQ